MKKLFTTVLFIAILSISNYAQNCGSQNKLGTLSQQICSNDDPIRIGVVNDWNGPGLSLVDGILFFDPSNIDLTWSGTQIEVMIYYYDNCQQIVSESKMVFVYNCGSNCNEVEFPTQLPSIICHDDAPIALSPPTGEWYGTGVVYTNDGVIFDPSKIEATQGDTITTVITYGTMNNCNEYKEASVSVKVVNCEPVCDPLTFPVQLPRSICGTDAPIVLDQSLGQEEWWGEGVEYTTNGTAGTTVIFNPSLITEGTSTTISYGSINNCNEWETVTQSILVTKCQDCGQFTLDLDDSYCPDHNVILLSSAINEFEAYGQGISQTNEGWYFDPSVLDSVQIVTIGYAAMDDCGNWEQGGQTVTVKSPNECTVSGTTAMNRSENVLLPNVISENELAHSSVQFISALIYDSRGILVKHVNNANSIELNGLKKGVYTIILESNPEEIIITKLSKI